MNAKVKPTVRTIAAELGMSAMTVTRALNGHPLVSADTRLRVLGKVKEAGYDFRAKSRTLRQERARNVAIHCPDEKLYEDNIFNFYMRLHYLCVKRLKAEQLRGQLIDLNEHRETALEILENCGSMIILGPVEEKTLDEIRNRFPELKLLSIFGNIDGVIRVAPEDYQGGATAAKVFAEYGHSHAAVFTTLWEAGFRRRYGGFIAEFQARVPGARIDLIEFREQHEAKIDDDIRRKTLDHYFDSADKLPTACFVPNGYAGLFLADYLQGRGWRIPEDFSLISYDNLDLFSFRKPDLARVWFELKDLAAEAVNALQNLLADRSGALVSIGIPNHYTPGESVAAPRR